MILSVLFKAGKKKKTQFLFEVKSLASSRNSTDLCTYLIHVC